MRTLAWTRRVGFGLALFFLTVARLLDLERVETRCPLDGHAGVCFGLGALNKAANLDVPEVAIRHARKGGLEVLVVTTND